MLSVRGTVPKSRRSSRFRPRPSRRVGGGVVDAQQARGEPPDHAKLLVLAANALLDLLPLHAERRVRGGVVERRPRQPVLLERVAAVELADGERPRVRTRR